MKIVKGLIRAIHNLIQFSIQDRFKSILNGSKIPANKII